MSNYVYESWHSGDPFRPMTPKQRRRAQRKSRRGEAANYQGNDNPSRPRGLSGHPGQRRAQLKGRAS